jgi:Tol biopolymer transport system component
MKAVVTFTGALLVSAVCSAPLSAQMGYFGQNKVQYQTFKFKVLKTQHFDIYYYDEEADAARMAARMAERWYTRLSGIFSHELRTRQVVVLYGSGEQFRQTNVVNEDLGEGTGGVTEAYKRRIVLPFAGPIQATDHVLGHELVHAFQYDLTNTNASSAAAGQGGVMNLPLWFIEGMAEYFSLGPEDPNTAMWMREAIRRNKFPTIDQLDNPKYFPYRYGQALWAFIGGKYGDRTIPSLLRSSVGRDGYKGGFERVLGATTKEVSNEWFNATLAAYRPFAETTKMPSAFARAVITDPTHKGGMNVSPEVSPDGSRIVFFSSRDLFSIDLYVADAQTGKVLRKLTDTATNPHLESIEFIDSAGAWAHDSRRFAYPALSGGHPVLEIVDVHNGHREREIPIKDVDQILNPTWSPDDTQIAFSGLVGGYNDLFIYDLTASKLRRVTNDAYAELEPAWSPDGHSIAISTDRFSSDLHNLKGGSLRLALVDSVTGNVTELGGFDHAKNISAQWAPDGRSLYFISDRQGISNVYRMDMATHSTVQVTNLLTGAAGITELSPALSVGASQVAFSVYEEDGYNIYSVGESTTVAEAVNGIVDLPRDAGVLPPRTAGEGIVYAYLDNAEKGLPSATAESAYTSQPYKPKLALDFLGQPAVGVGVSSFGTYVGGGISASWSDVLGNHTVAGQIFGTNHIDEIGGSIMYLNRTHRWNWGVAFDETPYVTAAFGQGVDTSSGRAVFVQQEQRFVQTDRGFSGILAYPFGRADRIEVTGGLRQITGKQETTTDTFDYNTGVQLSHTVQTASLFQTLNLGTATTAFVHDTSIFGVASPIRGTRYRFEMDQTSGTLTYSAALADVRRYIMPVRPFTIALRGMYLGRFGPSAEDPLLYPLFIGYPDLVRGYDYYSFSPAECGNTTNGSCPVFDKLLGSRMMVGNAELRFPPWGAFGGGNFYGPLPLELAVFADAGAAWTRSNSLQLTGPNRDLVTSAGIAARVNILGFAVAEIDYVHPFDRPLKGWMWQFNLRPGF